MMWARDTRGGGEVLRRWDSDRSFYIVLSGRYDVFIDAHPIHTVGPGDHFGGARRPRLGRRLRLHPLATVRCAEPGRLLKLTSEDFRWLVDTEPTVKDRLAEILAERLQQR